MTLDATPAGAAADSYLTVAAADALAGEDLGPERDAWLKADVETKERALQRATREVDAYVATGWPQYDGAQALVFPREIDVDAGGDPIIPRKVVLATYQQALYVLKNRDALAAMNAHRAAGGTVDPDAAYSVDPQNGPAVISPMAMHYLAGFRTAPRISKGGSVRSARVRSGFIGAG